jgi:hypothetical protein
MRKTTPATKEEIRELELKLEGFFRNKKPKEGHAENELYDARLRGIELTPKRLIGIRRDGFPAYLIKCGLIPQGAFLVKTLPISFLCLRRNDADCPAKCLQINPDPKCLKRMDRKVVLLFAHKSFPEIKDDESPEIL